MQAYARAIVGAALAGAGSLAACGGRGGESTAPPAGAGSIQVSVATTGVELDPDGYTVTLGTIQSQPLAINGTATFADVPAGTHDLTLSGVAVSCTPAPSGARRVTVTANATTSVHYDVACSRKVILFVSDRGGMDDLYRMNDDGSGQVRLTTSTGYSRQPAWSPDGSKIAFVSNRDGNDEIYRMDATGASPVRLTNDPAPDGSPACSPDGTRIAFDTRRSSHYEIYLVDPDGGATVRRTTPGDVESQPGWSPHGASLVFVTAVGDNDEVCTGSASTGGAVNISQNGAGDFWLAWRP